MAKDSTVVVQHVVERIWNQGDLALADHLFTATYVNHGGLVSDLVYGPEAIKVSVAMYRAAFPELSITIDRLEADGDMVECDWTAYAVLCGDAIEPDRDRLRHTLVGRTRGRLVHGQIAETWMIWDPKSRLCCFSRTTARTQDS